MGAGRNAHFGWVQESTWGTPVTPPTKFAEIVTENLRGLRQSDPVPRIRTIDVREGSTYDAKDGAAGPVGLEVNFEGMLRLFEHAFGAVVTANPDPGTRWTHTFSLASGELMPGKGLTLYKWADVGAGYSMQVAGAKVRSLKLSVEPRRNVLAEFDFVGKDFAFVAETAPTMPSLSRYSAGHQVTVEIDDAVRKVDRLELTINESIDDDKRVLGQKTIDEPVRSDTLREVSGLIEMDAASADWDKLRARTLFKLEALCQGAVLGTGFYRFDLTALKCLVLEDPVQVTGPGIVKSRVPFRVLLPTSGSMLDAVFHNGEAAVA